MQNAAVAFEFDPSWLVKPTKRMFAIADPPYSPHPATAFIHYALDWFRTCQSGPLWLIDRRIRRSQGSRRPAARYQGLNTSYHKILANEVSNKNQSAFEFLEQICMIVGDIEERGGFDRLFGAPFQVKFRNVWVLECRDL